MPDYVIKGGEKFKIITDHLGSVRYVVRTSDGSIVQQVEYDSFGNIIEDTNPGFTPFGFAGGIYDPDTKLIRFGARDYDAEVGRWTAKDPVLFFSGSSNIYAYIENDPINFIDPLGLKGNCPDQFDDETMCQFYNLFKLAGYGFTSYERMAELRVDENGKYYLNILPSIHGYMTDSASVTFDSTLVGLVHTHPDRATPYPTVYPNSPNDVTFKDTKTPLPVCVYVLHKKGIWKWDPSINKITDKGKEIYNSQWHEKYKKLCKK